MQLCYREAYAKAVHLEGKCKKEFVKATEKIVNKFVFQSSPITDDKFVELTNNHFKNDKEKFVKKIKKGLEADFRTWGQRGTGSITEEEFMVAYKSIGMDNEGFPSFQG